jgi:hypothetical protein
MFSRTKLFDLFTRTPREGGRKDLPMPEAQTSQPAPSAAAPAAEKPDDVARQLATLTEAMRQLAESHKTLLEAVKPQPLPAPATSPSPANGNGNGNAAPAADIGGDPAGGGQRPGAVVDYSRLSPVQQITLGLKDSAPRQVTRAGAD